jgi:hypothetical protein
MFWLIAAAVALVLFALAWWSSGRTRKGVNADALRRGRGALDGNVDAARAHQRPLDGPLGP